MLSTRSRLADAGTAWSGRVGRVLASLSVTCALLLALPALASAQTFNSLGTLGNGSNFEGGDAYVADMTTAQSANTLVDANRQDWARLNGLVLNTLPDPQTDDPNTPEIDGDSSFTGGDKESEPVNWAYLNQLGGVTPGKDNVFAAWASTETKVVNNVTNAFLYLAFYREATSGDTFLTFELNQAPGDDPATPASEGVFWSNATGTMIPCRQGDGDGPNPDDFLISYEVNPSQNDDDDIDVVVYRWKSLTTEPVTQGGVTYQCGKTGTLTAFNPSPNVIAAMNFGSEIANVLDPDGAGGAAAPATMALGRFGEAALNLSAILGGAGQSCLNFGSWQLHSRSSHAIDSQLQDVLGPRPIIVRTCGARGVKYNDQNGNGTREQNEPGLAGWRFYVDRDGSNTFTTGDPISGPSDSSGNWEVAGVTPLNGSSTFAIRELPPAGANTDWRCTDPGGSRAQLPADAGCERTVTFDSGIKTVDDGGNALRFGNFLPATIVITKDAVPNALTDWAFTTTRPSDESATRFPAGFSLDDDANVSGGDSTLSHTRTFSTLMAGTYTVSETAADVLPWDTTLSCSVTPVSGTSTGTPNTSGSTATISLAAGETVSCTFTNTKRGAITGVKFEDENADGDQDAGELGLGGFTFWVETNNTPGFQQGDAHAISASDGTWTISNLVPGTYTVKEIAPAGQGWICKTNPCEFTVTVGAGQTKSVDDSGTAIAFANYRNGSISGIKFEDLDGDGTRDNDDPAAVVTVWINTNGVAGFQSTASGNTPADLHDQSDSVTGEWSITGITPGTYLVQEVVPEGWTCTKGCNGYTVTVTSGDSKTTADGGGSLEFGNYEDVTIRVEKQTLPDDHARGFVFTSNVDGGDAESHTLHDDDVVTIADDLAPGSYSVTETIPRGWRLTNVVCTDADASGAKDQSQAFTGAANYTVYSGDDVKCTFTNSKLPASIDIQKSADREVLYHGDSVTYTYHVKNTSAVRLHDVVVTDDKCGPEGPGSPLELVDRLNDNGPDPDDGIFYLDVVTDAERPETWVYACTMEVPAHEDVADESLDNVATVVAKDEDNEPVDDEDDLSLPFKHASIHIEKTGPAYAYDDGTIEFAIEVTNPTGDDEVFDVAVTDDGSGGTGIAGTSHGCDSLSAPTGDTDNDGGLDPGETWTYVCRYQVRHGDEIVGKITNTATVAGVDGGGHPVGPDTDDATTTILHPSILLEKTGPATAQAGDRIPYDILVTNTGDEPFNAATVVVNDPRCDGSPQLVSKNGDTSEGTMDPGDRWSYTCSAATQVGDTSVTNVADVCAAGAILGKSVCDDDDAVTTLEQPEQLVLPERIVPGAARLLGPTGCRGKAFRVRVAGTKIARVVFVLDGKRLRTLTRPNFRNQFAVRINPRTLEVGVHRLRATITFERGSGTRPKTLRLSFQRCARALQAPRFTG